MFLTTRGSLAPEESLQVFQELRTAPDRSAAIVGGSLVEMVLQNVLIDHLHPDEKLTKEMFRSTGAFGPFATKIHLGKLVGVYGAEMHQELVRIKNIRNRFAHDLSVRSFTDQQVASWCQNFKFCERYTIENNTPTPPKDPTPIPMGKRTWWFGVTDRDKTLRDPRGRYLTTVGAMLYALSWMRGVKMPKPEV